MNTNAQKHTGQKTRRRQIEEHARTGKSMGCWWMAAMLLNECLDTDTKIQIVDEDDGGGEQTTKLESTQNHSDNAHYNKKP